jgi:NADPH:quinone reductase
MRAAAIDRFGPPEVLTLHSVPIPQAGPGEVLIALHSAGVGEWDAEIRKGTSRTGKERFPLVLGTDGAGIVVAKGARVRRFEIDDRVWAYEFANRKGGFYAEFVAVADGETVLIFGATGAVGTLAVQFARLRGARVIATATGPEAVELVTDLGAEDTIDAHSDNAAEQLRDAAPEGPDAVLALAGGETLEQCLELIRAGGRVAYPNGIEPEPKRRRGVRIIAYDAVAGPREFADLERAVEEAHLRVVMAGVYPLERAAEAHRRVEQGHLLGRLSLRIRDGGS